MKRHTEYRVSVGGGIAPASIFDNEEDARIYYDNEMKIRSYFGPGHRRHGSFVRVTTIVEDMAKR